MTVSSSLSEVSGPAMVGDIHTTLAPSALLFTLFTSPKVTVRGHEDVTASQAKALMLGKDYAGINTTANFASPGSTVITNLANSTTNLNGFGAINSIRPPRNLQWMLRFEF